MWFPPSARRSRGNPASNGTDREVDGSTATGVFPPISGSESIASTGDRSWLEHIRRGVEYAEVMPNLDTAATPMISVVIPTCDRRIKTRKCVDSLLAQDLESFEVIVFVGICSTTFYILWAGGLWLSGRCVLVRDL